MSIASPTRLPRCRHNNLKPGASAPGTFRRRHFLRIVRPFSGRKWVVPFPDGAPEFRVEIDVQDPEQVASVADKYRVRDKNSTLSNEVKAGIEVARKTICNWEGEEAIFGKKIPVNDENKKEFLLNYVESLPNERVTLFSWVLRVAEDKEAIELKNS